MDPEEQEMIDSIINVLESDEESYFSPSCSKTDQIRMFSPQVTHKSMYPKKALFTPIIGFQQDLWSLTPFSLDEESILEGDLISKCMDQTHSRKIQNLFEKGSTIERETIFSKLQIGLLPLSNDIFGNYVIQRILECGSIQQRDYVYDVLSDKILLLSFNTYGCRVAQKLLEIFFDTQKFDNLFAQLKNHICSLITDLNGNHVVQKIGELTHDSSWLVQGIVGRVKILSNDLHGCRLIQQTLEFGDLNEIKSIHSELLQSLNDLCFSQYGNYIVQILLFRAPLDIIDQVNHMVLTNIEKLSCDKFGSNIVDKAIQQSRFRMELLNYFRNNMQTFYKLSNNAYGNYVIQNFCKSLDYKQLSKLNYDSIYLNTQFGQHVLQTLMKLR